MNRNIRAVFRTREGLRRQRPIIATKTAALAGGCHEPIITTAGITPPCDRGC